MVLLIFVLFLLPSLNQAQNACNSTGLGTGQKIICKNIFNWDQQSRKRKVPRGRSGLFAGPAGTEGAEPTGEIAADPIPETLYDCLDIGCICDFLSGDYFHGQCYLSDGSVYGRVQRKEYRMMTDSERSLYRQGFLAVRNSMYWQLSNYHSSVQTSPGAHSGPGFLPWHREFLKRLEIAIRTAYVNGRYPFVRCFIPYWDSSMDYDVYATLGISSRFSTLFTSELMGSAVNGYVTNGQFGNFQGFLGLTRRGLDPYPGQLTLIRRQDVDTIVNTHPLNLVLGATAGGSGCPGIPINALEFIHGNSHVWIGGDMTAIITSTNDPMFFLHHSYIDFVWEQWRLTRQSRSQRESQWNTAPTYCYSAAHRSDSTMVPFTSFINTDGLSNSYTDFMYTYQARPTCSSSRACSSRFFFCNLNTGRCVPRVYSGSTCRLTRGVDPCYNSACSSRTGGYGRCVAASMDTGRPEPPTEPITYPQITLPNLERCFNRLPCCMFIATTSECVNPDIQTQCPASCKACTPTAYKIEDDCSDRHKLCKFFKARGMCNSQKQWMAENCRKECGHCSKTRKEGCSASQKPETDTGKPVAPPKTKPYPPGPSKNQWCYNNNRCCNFWAKNDGCKKLKGILSQVCPASCTCTPIFDSTKCTNFIQQCPIYAGKGLCWLEFMKENCRRSCKSCLTPKDESATCSTMYK